MKKIIEPTPEKIKETMGEIYELQYKLQRPHIDAARRVAFAKRPETLFDKNGNMFMKDETGKLWEIK